MFRLADCPVIHVIPNYFIFAWMALIASRCFFKIGRVLAANALRSGSVKSYLSLDPIALIQSHGFLITGRTLATNDLLSGFGVSFAGYSEMSAGRSTSVSAGSFLTFTPLSAFGISILIGFSRA